MGRTFASRVSHPRLKWVILVFWLVAAAASTPLAAGLLDEQDNDIASWLPGDAESTIALERQIALGSNPDVIPAVIVDERQAGLTTADTEAIAEDAGAIGGLDPLGGTVVGPIPSGTVRQRSRSSRWAPGAPPGRTGGHRQRHHVG